MTCVVRRGFDCIYIHTKTYTNIHINALHIHVHIHRDTHTDTQTHIHRHTYTNTQIQTHISDMNTSAHAVLLSHNVFAEISKSKKWSTIVSK